MTLATVAFFTIRLVYYFNHQYSITLNVMRVNSVRRLRQKELCKDPDKNIHRHPSSTRWETATNRHFQCFCHLYSLLGEGLISKHVAPVVSHVYANCSSVRMKWELPPVEVLCTWNFYYFMKINSSEVDWAYKDKVQIELFSFMWGLQRNKSYSLQLTAFDLTAKPVGSPWRQEILVTPSGKNGSKFALYFN